jgi:NCS1 family nucleobase:cation symporter-1
MLADYFLIRKTELDSDELFKEGGRYSYRGGWNPVAFLALILGVLPNLPGFLHAAGFVETVPAIFDAIYAYAWFVGLFVAAAIYLLFSKREK